MHLDRRGFCTASLGLFGAVGLSGTACAKRYSLIASQSLVSRWHQRVGLFRKAEDRCLH